MSLASGYELVILDLDGVVYVGAEAIAGAPESIGTLVDSGTPVAYVTNNASRSTEEVASLLRSMGVPAGADEVLTSARAAAELLAADLPSAAPVLVVGAPALRDEIRSVGLTPVDGAAERPLAVVQGYGPDVGWAELAEACVAIRAGARWVATNTDPTLPSARGALPGNGSLVAALITALDGRVPDTVVGKPHPALFVAAARHRGVRRVLVVGDRLDTDIEGAARAGMDSMLVLTGVSTAADVLRAAAHERPTHIAADLGALAHPDDAARVPQWDTVEARAGQWRVTHDGGRLVLASDDGAASTATPQPVDAVRALAAGAWAHPDWTGITAVGVAAEHTLEVLGLDRFTAWSIRAASAA